MLDRYDFQARFVPMAVTLLPLGLVFVFIFPMTFDNLNMITPLGSSAILAAIITQYGRDPGKKKQKLLWQSWGGAPTTQVFSYKASTFSKEQLRNYHRIMHRYFPDDPEISEEFEKENPQKAKEVYEKWTGFLIERTRDKNKFPLVFIENVNYGMRRNLWGLRPYGIIISLITLIIMLWLGGMFSTIFAVTPVANSFNQLGPERWISLFINMGLLIMWCFFISSLWVRRVAFAYAEKLIASCENID